MTPERWHRVGALFDAALEQPAAAREHWLRAAGEPDDVVAEVLSLLASHDEATGFLERPAEDGDAVVPRSPGSLLGPYRIISILGRGGMGVVYEAEDSRLGRRVALKCIAPQMAQDERMRRRLRQEARAAAALSHPGIATVYAFEELDGEVVIASECLRGETLRQEIGRGPLPPERALDTALAIARALEAAHEAGVVHRDLKPENVLRTESGQVKILDFGLASIEPSPGAAGHTRLTEAGMVGGTPLYMAPEQLFSAAADFRADHFSFGVLLYEMLSGSPQAPHPHRVPSAAWPVIEQCLQHDPARRWPSTRALVAALEAIAASGATGPRGQRTGDGRPRHVAAGWWQFHQMAAAVTYWAMIWPAWHVHRWIVPGGLFFFLAVLASVVVAGNLRLHLWFSSRIYPAELEAQRAWVGPWVRAADFAFAALLVGGGLVISEPHTGWGAVLIGFGVGAAVAFLVIEPTTARATFGGGR